MGWFGRKKYDENGFAENGKHKSTGRFYDEEGFGKDGHNKDGINREGYNRSRYNAHGFFRNGLHIVTGTLCDEHGHNREWYTKIECDKDRSDIESHDKNEFDSNGIDKITDSKYDSEGYDEKGWDRNEFDRNGYYRNFNPSEEKSLDKKIRTLTICENYDTINLEEGLDVNEVILSHEAIDKLELNHDSLIEILEDTFNESDAIVAKWNSVIELSPDEIFISEITRKHTKLKMGIKVKIRKVLENERMSKQEEQNQRDTKYNKIKLSQESISKKQAEEKKILLNKSRFHLESKQEYLIEIIYENPTETKTRVFLSRDDHEEIYSKDYFDLSNNNFIQLKIDVEKNLSNASWIKPKDTGRIQGDNFERGYTVFVSVKHDDSNLKKHLVNILNKHGFGSLPSSSTIYAHLDDPHPDNLASEKILKQIVDDITKQKDWK